MWRCPSFISAGGIGDWPVWLTWGHAPSWSLVPCFYFIECCFFFYNNISLCCCQSHRPAGLQSCDYDKLRQIYTDISGFIKNHMAEDQKPPRVRRAEVGILSTNVWFYRAYWFVWIVLASLKFLIHIPIFTVTSGQVSVVKYRCMHSIHPSKDAFHLIFIVSYLTKKKKNPPSGT